MRSASAVIFLLVIIITYSDGLVPSPWVDNSLCSASDPPATCSMKKTACAPINQVLSPPTAPAGGLVSSIMTCANSSGAVVDLGFFISIGMAYAQGKPEILMEKVAKDPSTAASVRICVANSTGMLGSDGKVNRSAILVKLASQPLGADVAIPVAQAVMTCPEPVDGLISPFMVCLRKACMDNVSVAPTGTTVAAAGTPQTQPAAAPIDASSLQPPGGSPLGSAPVVQSTPGVINGVPDAPAASVQVAPSPGADVGVASAPAASYGVVAPAQVASGAAAPAPGALQQITPDIATLLQNLSPK